MKSYLRIQTIIKSISRILAYIAAFALLFIMFLTTVDVILRLIADVAHTEVYVQGTYELTQLFMIIIIFLAYAATEWDDGHVKVSILTEKLPHSVKETLQLVVHIILAVFVFLVTYCSWEQSMTYLNGNVSSVVLFLPYAPFAMVMTFGMLMFGICFVFKVIDDVLKRVSKRQNYHMDNSKIS